MRALWRHVTYSPIALWVVMADLPIATLLLTIEDEFRVPAFLVAGTPAWIAIVWIFAAAVRAQFRRGRMRRLLQAALTAHGEVGADILADGFPDIPFCVSRKWIYCAHPKEIDIQPLDQMAWAYGEDFIMRPWAQLAIWNRSAAANVLPLRKSDIAPALARLRQAAPWLPVGYNAAMKESWNADHRDFLALVDLHRQSRRPFAAPWAGHGVARVAAHGTSNALQDFADRKENRELARLTQRWNQEAADAPP